MSGMILQPGQKITIDYLKTLSKIEQIYYQKRADGFKNTIITTWNLAKMLNPNNDLPKHFNPNGQQLYIPSVTLTTTPIEHKNFNKTYSGTPMSLFDLIFFINDDLKDKSYNKWHDGREDLTKYKSVIKVYPKTTATLSGKNTKVCVRKTIGKMPKFATNFKKLI